MTYHRIFQVVSISVILNAVTLPAYAGWFSDTWHSATHSVEHVAKKTVKDVKKDAVVVAKASKTVAHFAEEHARELCKITVPGLVSAVRGVSCKVAATRVGVQCNAELDAETEGVSAPACDVSAFEFKRACDNAGRVGGIAIKPLINKICNKI